MQRQCLPWEQIALRKERYQPFLSVELHTEPVILRGVDFAADDLTGTELIKDNVLVDEVRTEGGLDVPRSGGHQED